MKIINKSGNENTPDATSFYIILANGIDRWEHRFFYFEEGQKYPSEEDAVKEAEPGDFVAKVTLVAKIV